MVSECEKNKGLELSLCIREKDFKGLGEYPNELVNSNKERIYCGKINWILWKKSFFFSKYMVALLIGVRSCR